MRNLHCLQDIMMCWMMHQWDGALQFFSVQLRCIQSDLYQSELLYISIHSSINSCVYLILGPMFRSNYSTLTIPLSVECAGLVMPTACVYLFSTAASSIFAPLPHPSTSSIDWCATRLEFPSPTPITMIQNILHPLKVKYPPPTLLNSLLPNARLPNRIQSLVMPLL